LCVLLIHSRALGSSFVFRFFVNHAVPIFIVLFGVNSELWWRRRALPADLWPWYRSRARRLLVPMWAALPVWWAAVIVFRPAGIALGPTLAVKHLFGYLAEVGTGWFVTMVIQLAILFPFMHLVAKKVGIWAVLLVATSCAYAAVYYRFFIISHWGLFNSFIFSPRFYAHVAFGMWLSTRLGRLDWVAAVSAASLLVTSIALVHGAVAPLAIYADYLLDLPLTVLLLVAMRPLERVRPVRDTLAWLGQSSYGIYLGQLLTHNACLFALGDRRIF